MVYYGILWYTCTFTAQSHVKRQNSSLNNEKSNPLVSIVDTGMAKTLLKDSLENSILKCTNRGLNLASIWACEQLIGMNHDGELLSNDDNNRPLPCDEMFTVPRNEGSDIQFAKCLIIAGEYQRCAHMLKCKMNNHKPITSQLGLFLYYYSQYLAGEKLRDQLYSENTKIKVSLSAKQRASGDTTKNTEKVMNHDNNRKAFKNNYLVEIYDDMLQLYRTGSMDGFLLYLFAVVVRDIYRTVGMPAQLVMSGLNSVLGQLDDSVNTSATSNNTSNILDDNIGDSRAETKQKPTESLSGTTVPLEPRSLFLESLALYPYNWSCWLELAALCVADNLPVPQWDEILQRKAAASGCRAAATQSEEELAAERTMYAHFLVHVYLDLHRGDLAMTAIEAILPLFPTSLPLRAQIGLALYAAREYDRAQASFELIRDRDPYRVTNIDTYSNILYVKENHAELSHLAHALVKVDKYAPETCCVVGNYYSLKGQHDRAIVYFQRALSVDPAFLSAWTLMGHEYMELRNTATAITCYRQALNISEQDYRAWYGLGQTYEMLHLYQYAAYYYKKAAGLRPDDARMWSAVGNCLLKLGLRGEAIAVLERAVACGDSEGISTRELAKLCRSEGQRTRAAEFYYKYLQTTPLLDAHHHSAATGGGGLESASAESLNMLLDPLPSVDAEQAEALLFLAHHHHLDGNHALAEVFCSRILNFTGPEGDEARNLIKVLRYSASNATPAKAAMHQSHLQRPSTARSSTGRSPRIPFNAFSSGGMTLPGSTETNGGGTSFSPDCGDQRGGLDDSNERPDGMTSLADSRSYAYEGAGADEEEAYESEQSVHYQDVTHMSVSPYAYPNDRGGCVDGSKSVSPASYVSEERSREVVDLSHLSSEHGDEDIGADDRGAQRLQSALFPADDSTVSDASYVETGGYLDDSVYSGASGNSGSRRMSVESSPQPTTPPPSSTRVTRSSSRV